MEINVLTQKKKTKYKEAELNPNEQLTNKILKGDCTTMG